MTTSTAAGRDGAAGGLSLNEKIAMCSNMIGCCHYLEQTSSALNFLNADVEFF